MEKQKLNTFIAQGKLEEAVSLLLEISNEYLLSFNKEILLLSSRYNALKSDRIKGIINTETYMIASNSITYGLIEIIALMDELDNSKMKKKSDISILEQIEVQTAEFEEARKISVTTLRLRMKNDIAQSIGNRFIQFPDVMKQYIDTRSLGIICGLCIKIQGTPEYGDLDIIERIAKGISSNFTKGYITNALASLIHAQKLQLGDDNRIRKVLLELQENADIPLSKNIERVEADLNYLLEIK